MVRYKVLKDMILATLVNDIGISIDVKVEKDEIIMGGAYVNFYMNTTKIEGVIYSLPSIRKGLGKPISGFDNFFIPMSNLQIILEKDT